MYFFTQNSSIVVLYSKAYSLLALGGLWLGPSLIRHASFLVLAIGSHGMLDGYTTNGPFWFDKISPCGWYTYLVYPNMSHWHPVPSSRKTTPNSRPSRAMMRPPPSHRGLEPRRTGYVARADANTARVGVGSPAAGETSGDTTAPTGSNTVVVTVEHLGMHLSGRRQHLPLALVLPR
jgi:hypothetical protein